MSRQSGSTNSPSTPHDREIQWSIITVSYNSARALEKFWSAQRLPPHIEWIVVDNASTDESAALSHELGAKVVQLNRNVGFGAANNIGFRSSRGQYIAFVNPDVRVVPADLALLQEELLIDPSSLVAPQLLNNDGSLQSNGRGMPYLVNKIRNRLQPDRLMGTYLRFAGKEDVLGVDWFMGAAVAGSRERLAQLGPWDERFFVYYEDSDLGIRNTRLGGTNKIVGAARWTHGWARETATPSFAAWKREIPSMVKFYSRYPALILPPTNRRTQS